MCFNIKPNSYFQKKKLSINPNQNSTKAIKGERRLCDEKLKNTYSKKKKSSTLIRVIRKNKNIPKERKERERVLTSFMWENYGLNERNDIKFIQNKMGRKKVKI